MKRILLAFLLLLALAVPAWGLDGTWTNATEDDKWDTAGNWDGGVPGNGEWATFDGSEAALGLPTVNLPDLSVVRISLVFGADYSTHDISEFSSLGDGSNSDFYVESGGAVRLDNTGWRYAALDGGTFYIKTATTVAGDIFSLTNGGTLAAAGAGAVVDGLVFRSAGSAVVTINWQNLAINGGVDANGVETWSHINTTGATLTCDWAGDLELGGAATGLAVVTSAAVDLDGDLNIYALSMGADITCAAARAATVGAGGFEMTAGTLTGTLNVDLSAAAGAYDQTDGEIAAAAVLNVTAGSGGFSFTALTLTGSLNVTQAATSTAVEWTSVAANAITCLTINEGVEATLDSYAYVKKCVNNGIITAGIHTFIFFRPTANDFWSGMGTYSGTSTSSGAVLNAARSNAAAFTWDAPMAISLEQNEVILTASGGIDCGNLVVKGPNTAGQWGGLTLPDGANLSCANLTLGVAASDRSAKVVLGAGDHEITGAIAAAGNGNAQAFTFGGRVYLGGSYDGTGITPTWGGALFATGNLTFDGKEVAGANASPGMDIFANAKTVTVQGVNNSTAATKVRVWNNATAGAANTNCVFHPGAPSGLSMTGMGL